jgi:hypothetical protein
VDTYDIAEAAERTGIPAADLERMCELGIIVPDEAGDFTGGHLRKIGVVNALIAAGIPLDGLGAAIRQGRVTLDFSTCVTWTTWAIGASVSPGAPPRALDHLAAAPAPPANDGVARVVARDLTRRHGPLTRREVRLVVILLS